MSEFIIGIDLGTTNCTMAYLSRVEKNASLQQFSIPQLGNGMHQVESFLLPSFLYFPLPNELKETFCTGLFAKTRGSEIPDRQVASAKSWLCNLGVDRREKILPYTNSEESVSLKMSPHEVLAEFLLSLKNAWQKKYPDLPFKEQEVLITVPASFDPAAKELVEESAHLADFPDVILIEEPLAAFYSWLHQHENSWRQKLRVNDSILVVDMGGGTTDFTLISVEDHNGNLELRRQAVGAHLLLGGDNLDLALAYLAKQKLEDNNQPIDDWQFERLKYACQGAKEEFLGENPPKTKELLIQGRGSKLIGSQLKVTLKKEMVQKLILEGFFPLVSPQERSKVEKRSGISEFGLPYAQDPRVSSQLAKFLSITGESESVSMENFVMPTKVLFNGGTLKAPLLRERLLELLNSWANLLKKPNVEELEGADFDFAVSRGATFYGHIRHGTGVRVKSGTSRSYFVGVEDARPAVPGVPISMKAICVVPFGMEEGSVESLENQEFALVLGEMASFRFFSRGAPLLGDGKIAQMGTQVKNFKEELTELHPIETILPKSEEDGKVVRVNLKAKVTELGMLELWCESQDERKWKLEFSLRT